MTERERAELALAEAEERLRLAVHAARLGTFDHRLQTGELRLDERMKDLVGLAPEEEIAPEELLARVHEEDRERVWRAVEAARDPAVSQGEYEFECRVRGRTAVCTGCTRTAGCGSRRDRAVCCSRSAAREWRATSPGRSRRGRVRSACSPSWTTTPRWSSSRTKKAATSSSTGRTRRCSAATATGRARPTSTSGRVRAPSSSAPTTPPCSRQARSRGSWRTPSAATPNDAPGWTTSSRSPTRRGGATSAASPST